MSRGKKICPKCSTELGVRSSTCTKCNHNFSSPKKIDVAPKEKSGKKEEKPSTKIQALLDHVRDHPYKAPPKITPDEHAERILSYGKKRAKLLLKLSNGKWSHVNWKKVEEGLK